MTDAAGKNVSSSGDFLDTARSAINTKTSYSSMNEWRDMTREVGMAHPVTMTDAKWHDLKLFDSARRDQLGRRADMEFRRAYTDLTSKIAYLHPNPGLPRTRQGRIGGTWRHIKEVLQDSGNRCLFIDGLVSSYDNERFNDELQAQLPHRPHLASPRFAPVARDLDSYHQRDLSTMQNAGYVPSFKQLPSIPTAGKVSSYDPDVIRKMNLQSKEKYKGVYRYK